MQLKNNPELRPGLVAKRLFIYCLGLFILALGVSFSVLSNLGVSPMNSVPYVLSEIITSVSMGTFTTALFCSYILIQAAILRREFSPLRLLQIFCSFLFGWFVDLTNWLIGLFPLQTAFYPIRLVYFVIGMACVGFGIFLYISPKYPPLPGEGVTTVISAKSGRPLHHIKIIFDATVTICALILSLVFFHGFHGVREGTIIASFGCGKFLGLFRKHFQAQLDKFLEIKN